MSNSWSYILIIWHNMLINIIIITTRCKVQLNAIHVIVLIIDNKAGRGATSNTMLGNIGINQNRGKEEDTQTCMHGRSIGVNKIKRKRKLSNTTFQLKSIINNNLVNKMVATDCCWLNIASWEMGGWELTYLA